MRDQTESLGERATAAMARATRLVEEAVSVQRCSVSSPTVDALAERAILAWRARAPGAMGGAGTMALVASASMGALLHLKELLASRVPQVDGATDAGTALGLAIAIQPDLAVIDARLELASGVDVALALPVFAPQTSVLVLTDDPERALELRTAGCDTAGAAALDAAVMAWVGKVA